MIKKHRVLLVHNYYQIPGGEDTVVSNEKKMLEDNGHEVILYTRHNNELKNMSLLQKVCLPVCSIFNLRTYRDIKEIIQKHDIDIVHVHNTLNLISPAVYYAALKCKIPIVQTIHNFRLLCPGATFYRDGHICEDCVEKGMMCAVKHRCYRGSRLQTLLCVVSTKIHRTMRVYGKINYICLTEFNKDKIIRLNQVKKEHVYIKPNFVECDRCVIPYKHRDNYFVYAGRLDKLKGIDRLLEIWKKMGDTAPDLLVCGTGPLEKWCKEFVDDNRLKNVKLMGGIPNLEVRKLIANSKALILPTRWYEGFPVSIVEAYSVGTPVLGSTIGNVGNILLALNPEWCIDFSNENEVRDKIINLSEDEKKIFLHYLEKYSLENNYKELIRIYDAVGGKK